MKRTNMASNLDKYEKVAYELKKNNENADIKTSSIWLDLVIFKKVQDLDYLPTKY